MSVNRSNLGVNEGPARVAPQLKLAALQDTVLFEMREGRFEKALAWARKALALIERLDAAPPRANCTELIAFLLWKLGRHQEAIEGVGRACDMWAALGDAVGLAATHSLMAHMLHDAGRREEAVEKMEESRKLYWENGWHEEASACARVADLWLEGTEVELRLDWVAR